MRDFPKASAAAISSANPAIRPIILKPCGYKKSAVKALFLDYAAL